MAPIDPAGAREPPEVIGHRINEGIAIGFGAFSPISILALIIASLSKSAITVDGWRPTGPVGSRGDDGLTHILFVDPKI